MGGVVEGYSDVKVPMEHFDEQLDFSNFRRTRKGKALGKRSYNKETNIKQL
jgi:hypothetical protein